MTVRSENIFEIWRCLVTSTLLINSRAFKFECKINQFLIINTRINFVALQHFRFRKPHPKYKNNHWKSHKSHFHRTTYPKYSNLNRNKSKTFSSPFHPDYNLADWVSNIFTEHKKADIELVTSKLELPYKINFFAWQ